MNRRAFPGNLSLVVASHFVEGDPLSDEARGLVRAARRGGILARAFAVRPRGAPVDRPCPPADGARTTAADPVHLSVLPAAELMVAEGARRNVGRAGSQGDRLPAVWVSGCNRMDEVWVGSSFHLEVFARSGVGLDRLRVVPSPIDAKRFRPRSSADRASTFVFASTFDGTPASGLDLLLGAYLAAFRSDEDVELRLLPTGSIGTDREAAVSAVRRSLPEGARLEHIGRRIRILEGVAGEWERARFLGAADAFVSPFRGTLLGRSLLEAASAGLPVIATRFASAVDFLHEGNAILLDCAILPVGEDAVAADPSLRGSRWAEPVLFHLQEEMARIRSDPGLARTLGGLAREEVLAKHDLPVVGRHLRDAVGERGDGRPAATAPRRPKESRAIRTSAKRGAPLRVLWDAPAGPSVAGPWLARAAVETGGIKLVPEGDRTREVVVSARILEGSTDGAVPLVLLADGLGEPLRDADGLERAAEVWTCWPSVRERTTLGKAAANRCFLLPAAVDPLVFTPNAPPAPLLTTRSVRFLHPGGAERETGLDLLLSAYAAAFTNRDDVCLVVAAGAQEDAPLRVQELQDTPGAPEVLAVSTPQDAAARAALYAACGVLVLPFRDERVAEAALEAMACGKVAVCPGVGVSASWGGGGGVFAVPATRRPAPGGGLLEPAWSVEVDVGALARAMREIALAPHGFPARGAAARRFVEERAREAGRTVEVRLASLVPRVRDQASDPVGTARAAHPAA